MKLTNYSLRVDKKQLFENINITFKSERINHILGSNGVGKSCFAKSVIGLLKYSGHIESGYPISIIGSYSGVPQDFKVLDIKQILEKSYSLEHIKKLYQLLNIDSISTKIHIQKMSDGQKQKIKLWVFLSSQPKLIILDEFTTSLDKSSILDIYKFLNEYVKNKDTNIINITHNLSDIENMAGYYYYIKDKQMLQIGERKDLFSMYIKGV